MAVARLFVVIILPLSFNSFHFNVLSNYNVKSISTKRYFWNSNLYRNLNDRNFVWHIKTCSKSMDYDEKEVKITRAKKRNHMQLLETTRWNRNASKNHFYLNDSILKDVLFHLKINENVFSSKRMQNELIRPFRWVHRMFEGKTTTHLKWHVCSGSKSQIQILNATNNRHYKAAFW